MSTRLVRITIALAAVACLFLGVWSVVAASAAPSHLTAPAGLLGPTDAVVYAQPPSGAGGLYQSSRNGTDSDQYVWDSFRLAAGEVMTITEVQWRGGYDPTYGGSGGTVLDFNIGFYPSIAAGTQPIVSSPLKEYPTGGVAGETPAGIFGNIPMYDYHFLLPTPLKLTGPATYWLQVEADQGGTPDWGLAVGTGGNGVHFLRMALVGDIFYRSAPGDTAFSLWGMKSGTRTVHLPFVQR